MMHFGRYSVSREAIDFIELNGDGSYDIQLCRTVNNPERNIHVGGEDAESLRIALDEDRRADELPRLIDEVNLTNLKAHT